MRRKKKIQETKKKLSSQKKNQINCISELGITQQNIKTLNDGIIFESDDDNVLQPFVFIYN